jgi:aspartokinase/homoserine dehydrogenase 1
MKILKFGGTSVGTPQNIEKVIAIINHPRDSKIEAAVVVSAFAGVTDALIQISHLAAEGAENYQDRLRELETRHLTAVKALIEIRLQSAVLAAVKLMINELEDILHGVFLIRELTPKTLDFVLSFGERLSAFIIAETLRSRGINAEFLDAREVIQTNTDFGKAKVDFGISYPRIQNYFATHSALQIITGFLGATPKKETTTLGRGGSDYSAALFGAALDANEVEIWTDVDGLMCADPRKVPGAFSISQMSYEEAMEMAHFGARVIHPPTMQPLSEKKIPLRIKNTFNPKFEGTFVGAKTDSQFMITGISSIDEIALLRIQGSGMIGVVGISQRLFGALARQKINVILISQASSEHSICIAVAPGDAERAKETIESEFHLEILARQVDEAIIENHRSVVAVVGENMRKTPGISGKLFSALGKFSINVVAIAQGSSELNISIVIAQSDQSKALNAIYEVFFQSDTQAVNLFLVGTGLIGSTLLKQIAAQSPTLFRQFGLNLKIWGLANINKMLLNKNGISAANWETELSGTGEPINPAAFIAWMKKRSIPNCVFVDCTASEALTEQYESILCAGISIVTPNKKANSGSTEKFRRLRRSARSNGAKFYYETNVGAGLPIISTLKDLLRSGDEILKVEAVLSGTLNYIFSSLSAVKKLSDVVREARIKGYSEPDPRDDLNGLDFARKMLILAREIGYSLELEEISIEALLPPRCLQVDSVEKFFAELLSVDADFEAKRRAAEAAGKRLRFVGVLEKGHVQLAQREIGAEHPFYNLTGSDNMIVFTTARYRENPLSVRGPGAGAEVTAGGIFADIIRIFVN